MITELVVRAFSALVQAIGSIMPSLTLPDQFTSALATFGSYAAGYWKLGHILPVSVMAACFGFLLAAAAAAVAIRLIRIVASFFTAGGGM